MAATLLEYMEECNEERFRQAKEKGWLIVEATDKMLQIDLDSETEFTAFNQAWEMLQLVISVRRPPVILPSKSGLPRRHVTIHLMDPLPIMCRIALQALLGSDPNRERSNYIRATLGVEKPIVFFELPPEEIKLLPMPVNRPYYEDEGDFTV